MTYFNKYPKNQIEQFTEAGIVSKEGDAAKKLLQNIRGLINSGDIRMNKVLAGESRDYFSKQMKEPNNTEQLTWGNGSKIKCYPPTPRVRGEGFSWAFWDEVAHTVPPKESVEDFYLGAFLPTVADNNAPIMISSTPNGPGNQYYNLYDPDNEKNSEYVGIHFTWEINKDNEDYVDFVKDQENKYRSQGRYKKFRQEFYGDFTVTEESFFELADVEKYFDKKKSSQWTWDKSPCSIGLDFGVSICSTVVTVKTKYRNKIILLYQRTFPKGYDLTRLTDKTSQDGIYDLMKRYKVAWIVPDNCPQGDYIIKWLRREGLPCQEYSFHSVADKNKAYYRYRSLLVNEDMTSYPIEELKWEMINIREEEMKKFVSIHKPSSGSDDRIDSDVFATVPFMEEEESSFAVENYVPIEEVEVKKGLRVDHQWERLQKTAYAGYWRKL